MICLENMPKTILLTFDVEEFDLPQELGNPLKDEFNISSQGLNFLLNLLSKHNIKSTFFTTAHFAKNNPKLIKRIHKEKHEMACHGYYHSDSYINNLSKIPLAKKEIEKIIKQKIVGFRAPRFEIKDISKLSNFGFQYDSSIHPTFIPGRYMNINNLRKIHKIGNIIEIPLSVLPLFRLPIFWLAFKNFGLNYSKIFTKINPEYTMLVMHPWEFADLSEIKIPFYIKRKSGVELLEMFDKYIRFCKQQGYEFRTVKDYLNHNNF
jgi:peptidoglycan/xylan/chitin deacetylase (PgdA/CDA1 family)